MKIKRSLLFKVVTSILVVGAADVHLRYWMKSDDAYLLVVAERYINVITTRAVAWIRSAMFILS